MYLTVAFQPPDDFEPLARRLIKLFNHPKPFVTDPLEAFVPVLQFSDDAEQFLVRMGGRGGERAIPGLEGGVMAREESRHPCGCVIVKMPVILGEGAVKTV